MSVVSVYAIFANAEEAGRIGRIVVDERLAACVNIRAPVTSSCRWRGARSRAAEVAATPPPPRPDADALITRVAGLHSYDVPCIVTWPVDKLLAPYADWVETNVG